MDKLPKPLFDFLGSQTLTALYLGIGRKLELNLRQLMIVNDVANVTLMGLEPESAMETNLHQGLPELSNEKTRELVADINDRIFKEAKRRVRENIVTPEPTWDEAEYGPKESYKEPPRGAELQRLADEEEKAGGFKPPEPEEETPAPAAPEQAPGGTAPTASIPAPQAPRPAPASVADRKLAAPTVAQPRNVTGAPLSATPPPQAPPPEQPPAAERKADPYREPIE